MLKKIIYTIVPSKNSKYTEKFALESAEKNGKIIDKDCVKGIYWMTKQYYTNRVQAIDHKNRVKESPEILKDAYFKGQISSEFYQCRLQKMYHKGKITAAEVSLYVNMSKPSVVPVSVCLDSAINLVVEEGWTNFVGELGFHTDATGTSNFSDAKSIEGASKFLDKMMAFSNANANANAKEAIKLQRDGGGENEDAPGNRRSTGLR